MKPSSSFQNPMSDDTDKNMNELFKNVKSESYDSSYDEFDFWFRKKTLNNQSNQTMKNSFNLKYFLSHNRIKLAIIAFLLLTIAACNMPVTSTNTLGYLLSWESPRESSSIMMEEVGKIDKKFISTHEISGSNDGKTELHHMILQDLTGAEAENISNKIRSVAGVSNVKLTPMTDSETMPLYSYALENFLKIEINREGKTDEEVTAEIYKQLEQSGFKGAKVSYENINGKKRLMVTDFNMPEGGQLEINVDNNNGSEVIKLKKMPLGDEKPFENMTDEQIREQVKKDNPGVQDKDITIERTIGKDGKPEVKIKVERDEEVTK
ncbi:MAG TPA: hypothetical protein VHP32_02675 [Ignavibacteria bacterium]|nr:hypothetical protein [Ignavibacteria bacterium]